MDVIQRDLEQADETRWNALFALTDAVTAYRALQQLDAPIEHALDMWLEERQADYRKAADAYEETLRTT